MANIFQIKAELQELIDVIEENGGEVDDELFESLLIKQDELKDKVESYVKVITSIKSDIDLIDAESKRLKTLKDNKTKMLNRLQNLVIDAVDKYGEKTKTGGSYIEYPTFKVNIRNSTKVDVNKEVVDSIVNQMFDVLKFRHFTKEDTYMNTIEELFEDYNNYSEEDKKVIKLNFSFDYSLDDLKREENVKVLKAVIGDACGLKIEGDVYKTECKNMLKDGDKTCIAAQLVNNKTLTIK